MSSFRRLYSTATQTIPQASRGRFYQNFDKTMYYPIVLTIIFGSQLINLMNKQRDFETLERKYALKITKIDEIKQSIKDKGVENVNVEEELALVNRLFTNAGAEASLSVSKKSESKTINSKDLEDDLKEEDLLKMLGISADQTVTKSSITKTPQLEQKKSELLQQQQPKLSEMNVSEQLAFEKDLQNFRVKPENHTIVEIPGDYVEAAKDTKVPKFL